MKDIIGKAQLVRIANAIQREVEEGISTRDNDYKVKRSVGMVSVSLYVYSSRDGYITSSVIHTVQAIVGRYEVMYGACVFYGIDYLPEEQKGCLKINVTCIEK